MFREAGVSILGGVENMHELVCPHCQSHVKIFPVARESRAIWSTGVEKLAELPFEPGLAHLAEQGRPLLIAEPEGAQAERFRQIAARIATALKPG